jgi:NAD(P)-dependent dehydrogenase (short-subunit alcohol dehydrogenase family)
MQTAFPKPPFEPQSQPIPGSSSAMRPQPDYGVDSYTGTGRLKDKKVLLTGGDSGIGRAVALAYAREGADLVVSYLNEHEDAAETKRLVEEAGRQCLLAAGDISKAEHCRSSKRQWRLLVNADSPSPQLLAYATTKGAIQNFTGGLAQLLAERGIRANTVAPGPVWTPLIPSTMPPEKVEHFGEQVPVKRPAQPKELVPIYVMLASNEASYVSGATVAVTGGKPII